MDDCGRTISQLIHLEEATVDTVAMPMQTLCRCWMVVVRLHILLLD